MFGLRPVLFEEGRVYVRVNRDLWLRYLPDIGGIAGMEYGGHWEQRETELLLTHTPKGGVFIDVGANFGWFSLVLAKERYASVHAFEPAPLAYAVLIDNIRKNRLGFKIRPHKMAVDKHKGHVLLTEKDFFGNTVVDPSSPEAVHRVNATTIDRYVAIQKFVRLDSIKCDVEGYELPVLLGATKTIERFHPVVLVELHKDLAKQHGWEVKDVFSFFTSRKYTYKRITEDGRVKSTEHDPAKELSEGHNFFFYHAD